jgi:GTP-binding protein
VALADFRLKLDKKRMTVETANQFAESTEAGRKLFAGPAEFVWAAASQEGLPPIGGLEIAFAGRSNVGKSSLVNALTGRKTLARTSHTPGRTQQLNFFEIGAGPAFTLVDMPGYGYAAAGKEKVAAWTRLIHSYLRGRVSLGRVYVLIDSRHGIKSNDTEVLDMLDSAAVSYQIALTKVDEPTAAELAQCIAVTEAAIAKRPAAFPVVIPTSSRTNAGVPELRQAIADLIAQRAGHG